MRTVRLFRSQGPDHVAVVSLQASWTHPEALMVALARGPARRKLGQVALLGPYRAEEAEARLEDVVRGLRGEGFVQSGLPALIERLESPKVRTRALAAVRLGWLREPGAVEPLLAAAERAGEDLCALVDALGALGDPRAIPLARAEAARKLLSRRRSGVEALRSLNDQQGLAEARGRALERLPPELRASVESVSAEDTRAESVQLLVDALTKTPLKDRGLALDTLYDLATPFAAAAVREGLRSGEIEAPHVWRYAKSILKRAMLRRDAATFGWLAHRVESLGSTATASQATVKSGYDGKTRVTSIFGRRTRDYVRRASWRYLRRLATYRPDQYVPSAVEAIVHYVPQDEDPPEGDFGAYSRCYLLHRVLWGASSRYELRHGALRFRLRPGASPQAAGVREEAYPELWDAQPRAYLRLLAASRLIVVQEHALTAIVDRHPGVVAAATHAEIVALLGASFEPTVELGLTELRRRFDPARPLWEILDLLLADERERVRSLGLDWLAETVSLWSRDAELCCRFLAARDAGVRAAAARMCEEALGAAPAEVRRTLAERLLRLLAGGEPQPGVHEALARVARQALLDELVALAEVGQLVRSLDEGSGPMKAVAAAILEKREDALEVLGLPRIAALARHELVDVRLTALALLRRALPRLTSDPSLLLEVAECDWPDSRAGAVELAREIDWSGLTLEAVLGLLDSSHSEVQELGREILTGTRERWDPALVLSRLLEHPSAGMRPFVLEQTEAWLGSDLSRLSAPSDFLRKVLFDLAPSRAAKSRAIELLAGNGERDESLARLAVPILADLLRTQTRQDFEEALAALLRIHLSFPEIELPAAVTMGGGA